jgi:photosystem II stability/assembly factor-like uncharacterized protein
MELTRDGGASWTFIKTQCTASNFIAKVATASNMSGDELWELCMDYPDVSGGNVSHKVLFVSEDGGQSWSRRATWVVSAQQAGSGYLTVMTANGPGTAVMATNESSITITKDGGRTWTEVGPPGIGFLSIRFANLAAGWAIDVNQYIWATTDAGNTWTQLPAIPQA